MKRFLICFAVLMILRLPAASPFIDNTRKKIKVPQELAGITAKMNRIQEDCRKHLELPEIERASDPVFLRRAYLTASGRIPTLAETQSFLRDKSPDKRAKLIDKLLASREHADLIAMRFADMLRVKSEFPVNLWPNAVQAFHEKLRTDILNNRPYSEMAYEMLTASGSNFRVPYANFFRGSGDRTPAGLAKITALTFMGLRVEKLPEDKRKKFEAFFSRIRFKSTSEWKEELVFTAPEAVRLKAWLPGCGSFTINAPDEEPRLILAKALVSDENPYFARAMVNRVWSWFFGKGLIDPADDITPERGSWDRFAAGFGLASVPAQEKMLELLTEEFRRSKYDMRRLFRVIMNSGAFNAASIPPDGDAAVTEKYFLTYPVRRVEAEIISDSIGVLTGNYGRYTSVIPEPFTFLPPGTRAVQIADGSISSVRLDLFGRPSRDSGKISDRNNKITGPQRLYLLNSNTIYKQVNNLGSQISRKCKWQLERRGIGEIYLRILSRAPTPLEKKWVMDYNRSLPRKMRGNVWADLCWVLINSKEFLYYH